MNHPIPSLSRRNRRALFASLLSYLLLAGQLTPLVLASNNSAARIAPSRAADVARERAGGAPTTEAAPAPVRLSPVPAAIAPNITATKTDSYANSPNPAEPGDTITYTVTISNTGAGATDATGVVFTDTIDANTTFSGTAVSTPIAVNDAYSVIGNVQIQPNAAQGLLANDNNPNTGNNTGLTVTTLAGDNSAPFSGTSANGGQVTSSLQDGSFVYNPAPGFSGTDTFDYIVTSANGTNTGTVTLTVSTPIWFIDDTEVGAAGGDGRLTNPYNCYTGTSVPAATCFSDTAADDPGDFIFLFSGNYTGGYTLLQNQQLIGQGASATLATIAGVTVQPYSDPLPATGGAPPVITTTLSGTNAVNLGVGNSNNLRGFTVGNTTGSKIASTASGFGTLTVSEVTLNGNGQALNLDSGTLNAIFISISSNTSGGAGINLDQMAGSMTSTNGTSITDPATQCVLVTASTANLTFNNTTCTLATDGISLQNNSAGTRAFGSLSVSGGSGVGFLHANGGGTTTIGGPFTITNPAGNGIDIQNSNVNFSFPATSVDKGTTGNIGVNLVNNSGRTITFSTLDINTSGTGGTGLVANNSGAVNVTTAAGSEITSASNPAMVLSGGTALGLNFTLVQSTNSTGKGIELNAVTGGISVATTTITNPTNIGLHALNNTTATAGTFSFGNTAVTQFGNTAVRLEGNAKALTFADLDITTPDSSQRGLHATTNTGTITTTSGDITTTTGTAVEITGTSSTPLNMTLTKVDVSGGPSGIVLQNTTANPGGFSVIGDNSNARNGSGGVMNNTTDDAIRLTNATNITLKSINLNSPGDTLQANVADNENTPGEHGVEIIGNAGSGSSNIILSGMLIDSPAGSGIIGLNVTGTNRLNNNSLVTNIDNPQTHGLFLRNGSGFNLTLFEVNDTDFTNSSSGASTVNVKNDGTANMTVEVENGCIFEALDNQAVTMDGGGTAGTTGTLTSLVNGNTFRNAVASEPSPGVFITSENNVAALVVNGATHNATISNNTFENIAEDGRVANTSIIRTQNSGGKLTAVVSNNLIQNIAYQTGAGGRHVIGHVFEPTSFNAANFSNLRFEGNTATNITFAATNREFIFVDYRDNSSGGDIKILSNNWNMPTSAATSEAMELNFQQLNASTIDLQVDNNGQGTGAISNTSTRFLRIDSEDAATVNATVTNNKFTNNNATPGQTIDFNTLDTVADAFSPTMCVNVSGNTLLPSPAANTIRFNEAAGAMNITQASSAAVTAANNGAAVTIAGTPQFAQPACALPTNGPVTSSSADAGTDSGTVTTSTVAPTQQTATTSRMGGGVTSRAFVSMPRQTAPATTTTTTAAQGRTATTTTASRTTSGDTILAGPPVVNGDTLTFAIGNLPAGESVTITFSVTIDDPFPAISPSQVSNQGTVTCTECPAGGIPTDDSDVAGANQPTVTPVLAPPDIAVRDASGPEPASGSSTMAFTVVLSLAPSGPVSVDFTTADEPAGPGKATAGVDYTTTAGTLSFAAGQRVQTISVPVLADGVAGEPDETFLVNLSNAVGGIITDGQAVGTITAANPAGAILITELRTFGPGGAGDDFVEVYNNSNSQHTVTASDNSAGYGIFRMGATCTDTPVLIGTIPNGTTILGRGHFLLVGSQYSLGAAAAGNLTMSSDLGENSNVGIFNTSDVANLSTATRLDAVGFSPNTTGNNCDLLREGGALPSVDSTTAGLGDHSFYRSYCSFVEGTGCTTPNPGFPVDRNDNTTDFLFVDTAATAAAGPSRQRLGAPGPENMASARVTDNVGTFLIDANKSSSLNPNRVRKQCAGGAEECDPNRSQFGTMSIRRRFTNTTGGTVTQLRFRVVELTTIPRASATMADMRPISSVDVVASGVTDAATCAANGTPATAPCSVTIKGTTVEAPAQPIGGGYNTTMVVVLPGGGLLNNASVSVQFMLGVQQTGNYRFLINIEALP